MVPKKQVTIQHNTSRQFFLSKLRTGRLLPAILLCIAVSGVLSLSPVLASDTFATKRYQMVAEQIKGRGIEDLKVLHAMSTVPRHLFVQEMLQHQAYIDGPLPIGHGQTISQPYIVAYMTDVLQIQPEHRVLEIGTGSGYQAAILAQFTDQVYTIEIIPELAERASKRLEQTGNGKIHVSQGDGYHGLPDAAPFDRIMVTAAAEFIPPPLLQQLAEGGRMIIPVGSPFFVQHLMLVEKKQGKISTRSLIPVRFVPFRRTQ